MTLAIILLLLTILPMLLVGIKKGTLSPLSLFSVFIAIGMWVRSIHLIMGDDGTVLAPWAL
jgi:hypothetical protein